MALALTTGLTAAALAGGAVKKAAADIAPLAASELLKGLSPFVRKKRQLDKAAMAALDRDQKQRLKTTPAGMFAKTPGAGRSPEYDADLQKLYSGAVGASFEQSGRERAADLERVEGRAEEESERIRQIAGYAAKRLVDRLREAKGEAVEGGATLEERLAALEKKDTTVTS